MSQAPTPSEIQSDLAFAAEVLRYEAEAISQIRLDPRFTDAVELILSRTGSTSHGSLVVSGLGKSGLVGQKISATFSSTGTPSHFLHPTEAVHGDLGRLRREDVTLLLSYGGSTEEIVTLASILKQDNAAVIAIVGHEPCDLARLASIAIPIGDITEACPLRLAPTASTTAMLALGDALALSVSRRRDFGVDDFKKFHPGGQLGRMLMPVVEVMRFRANENLLLVTGQMTVQQGFDRAKAGESNLRRAGALVVIDDAGRLAGIFTDGDLRRCVVEHGGSVMTTAISELMTRNPRRLTDQSMVRDAVRLVREHRIDELPVVDGDGKPIGLIDVQDLMALKVIEG